MKPISGNAMRPIPLACLLLAACLGAAEVELERYPRPEDAPAFAQPTFISQPPLRAYPGALYETRPAVTGGTWPYRFSLRGAPTGMTIDARSGAITWPVRPIRRAKR